MQIEKCQTGIKEYSRIRIINSKCSDKFLNLYFIDWFPNYIQNSLLIIWIVQTMNKNISPINSPSLLLPKYIVSPFKKLIPRKENQSQQLHFCSSVEYNINTPPNHQKNKNLSQLTHGEHVNNNLSFLQSGVNPRQEITFVKQKSPQNQKNLSSQTSEPIPFSCKNFNDSKNVVCNRNRKLAYNKVSMSSISPIISTRKSEMRTNNQNELYGDFSDARSRKLSHQINTTTHSSQFLYNNTYQLKNSYYLSLQQHKVNQLQQTNPNCLMKKKIYDGQSFEEKTSTYHFYSLKSIPNHLKSPFNSIKQTKFRKNSDHLCLKPKHPKIQLPSFLIKKIQKQSIQNLQQQENPIRLSSFYAEKQFSLKDFKVLKQLGQGKSGKVLLVKQKATGFICAMKVFKKSQLKQDNFIDQFIRQLKIQFYLNHPNIIKMYGYFDDLSYIYVLLEAAFDGTLYQFLQGLQHDERLCKSGNDLTKSRLKKDSLTGLSLKQTALIMHQVCSAIKHLHSHNIIHRDLKPQNIVIHEKTIKLCDFGWSVFKGTEMRTTFCGTPLYLCPQLIRGERYDQKVDVWAIGIMLYQFLIGPNPFNIKEEGDLANIILKDVEINSSEERIGDLGVLEEYVIDLIRGCLNKNPIERLDIKQIVNHEFFNRYCPQQMSSNNSLSRQRSLSMSQTLKSVTPSEGD